MDTFIRTFLAFAFVIGVLAVVVDPPAPHGAVLTLVTVPNY
jgi:hypothetical protein